MKASVNSFAAGLVLPVILLFPASAQTAAHSTDSGTVLHIETRRVVEDITVTDSHGRPVQGLTQSDFRIFENGVPQTVVFFEEHRRAPASSAPLPALPPNTFSNLPDPKASGPLNVILYDLVNTPWEYQHYAHEELLAFLKTSPPGRYAIFVLGKRLEMLQGFTTNRDAVLAAGNGPSPTASTQPGYLEASDQNHRDPSGKAGSDPESARALDPVHPDLSAGQAAKVLSHEENIESEFGLDQRVRITEDAFTTIANFLMPLTGRKNLLWISGSFPLSVLPTAAPVPFAPPDSNYFEGVRNYTEGQKKVEALLTLSHTAIYAVDARGLQVPPIGFSYPFTVAQSAEHATLSDIADETGGRAFLNTNGLKEAFAKAVDEGSNYYTLTYAPTNKEFDGRFRTIHVELSPRGYELSYRRGYSADEAASAAHEVDSLGVALQWGTPEIEDLPFLTHLTAGKPAPATPEQLAAFARFQGVPQVKLVDVARYAVDFALLSGHVNLISGENGSQNLAMEFAAYAYGPEGQRLNGARMRLRRTLIPEMLTPAQKKGYRYRLLVDVPVTARYLRVGVRDNLSNRLGVVELPLPLAAQPGGAQ
jgi:VWFA-related protein